MNAPIAILKTEQISIRQPGAPLLAAQYLNQGELVVFPTDTVYGIGANPFDPAAIDRVFAAKERPAEKGIPILLGDISDLEKAVAGGMKQLPAFVHRLLDQYWPGPLTLVLPKADSLAANVSQDSNVAVRLIDHDLSRAFIRAAGGVVAATSANLSGQPAARTGAEAMRYFRGRVALVLDDGLSQRALASTILDCTPNPPRLLREGPISLDDLASAAGVVILPRERE